MNNHLCDIAHLRQEHQCLVPPSYSRHTQHLEQLSGAKLAHFMEGIEFCSPRQKVI